MMTFFLPKESYASGGNKKHILNVGAHHTWKGGTSPWDRGAPGSQAPSSTVPTLTIDLTNSIKGMGYELKDVKSVDIKPYDRSNVDWQEWDNKTFYYNETVKMNQSPDHKGNFDDLYQPYFARNLTVTNKSYNSNTGRVSFKRNYHLSTMDGNNGLDLQAMLRQGQSGKTEVLNWIGTDQDAYTMQKINEGVGNTNPNLRGYAYFTPVVITVEFKPKSEMILRELELVDPVTGKVLESFKRNIDPLDPFNKQSIVATHNSIKDASVLKRNKKYKIRAKYQYIDFSEGEFNISGAMTDKQKALTTGVSPNKLDVKYAYDENTTGQGIFDVSGVSTSGANELKNLEIAPFEWDYTVPNGKKAVKIAGYVPTDFAKKNMSTKDDFGVLYAMVEPADLGLNEPLVLKVDGKTTNVPVAGKTHTVTVNAEYLLGSTPLGLSHNGQPTGNDRFTILVSAREGSGNGRYLKKEEKEKNT